MKVIIENQEEIIISGTNTGLILKTFMKKTNQNATKMKKHLNIKYSETINTRITSLKKNEGKMKTFLDYAKALYLEVNFEFKYNISNKTKVFKCTEVQDFFTEYMDDFKLLNKDIAEKLKLSNFSNTRLNIERTSIRIKKLFEHLKKLKVDLQFIVICKRRNEVKEIKKQKKMMLK